MGRQPDSLIIDLHTIMKDVLKLCKNSRKSISQDKFFDIIIKTDEYGKERAEVYMANGFIKTAYQVYKGILDQSCLKDALDNLTGFEFAAIIKKSLCNCGAVGVLLEEPIILGKKRTRVDIGCDFKEETVVPGFSLINRDGTEIPLVITPGGKSFEVKGREKVRNADIIEQLDLAIKSQKYNNTYGVILRDTSVSKDVLREVDRVGASLIRANNVCKNDLINNVLKIYSLQRD